MGNVHEVFFLSKINKTISFPLIMGFAIFVIFLFWILQLKKKTSVHNSTSHRFLVNKLKVILEVQRELALFTLNIGHTLKYAKVGEQGIHLTVCKDLGLQYSDDCLINRYWLKHLFEVAH